jgi:hypothetical protein
MVTDRRRSSSAPNTVQTVGTNPYPNRVPVGAKLSAVKNGGANLLRADNHDLTDREDCGVPVFHE